MDSVKAELTPSTAVTVIVNNMATIVGGTCVSINKRSTRAIRASVCAQPVLLRKRALVRRPVMMKSAASSSEAYVSVRTFRSCSAMKSMIEIRGAG